MNDCYHTPSMHLRARRGGYTLPHCGSPTCGVCPGAFKPSGPTRLAGTFVYSMDRRELARIRSYLGHDAYPTAEELVDAGVTLR
jgi:hypothetical protein